MGWTEAHRYYATLRTVEDELDRRLDGTLPWRPEIAEVFDSPRALLDALRLRWMRLVQAQVSDDSWGVDVAELIAAHPGLIGILAANDGGTLRLDDRAQVHREPTRPRCPVRRRVAAIAVPA